jgi:Tfp pilus assembly protein PilZ
MEEQRRSPRYECELAVDLVDGGKGRRVASVNVSRHGLFLATDEVIKERFLVALLIYLPDGPLNANAVVSRTVQTPDLSGVGVQFFAQSASSKRRWDEFVFGLAGKKVTPGQDKKSWSVGAPDGATFLIKLKDRRRLHEFHERNVQKGGLYMATPVIKEAGAEVALIIIHPETEEEYLLHGRVERVCLEAPKGMEITLQALDEPGRQRFERFIKTGASQEAISMLPPEARPREPTRPPPRMSTPIPRLPSARGDSLPYAFNPDGINTEDLSIDIMVDLSALEDSAQFGWEDVGVEDMVIDFDVTDPTDEATREIPTDDLNQSFDGQSSSDIQVPLIARSRIKAALSCKACKTAFGDGDFGPLDGHLGILASRRPYWCAKEDRLVGVVRLNSPSERKDAMNALDEQTLEGPVKVRALFQVADFSRTARCEACGGPTRTNRIVKEVIDRLPRLPSDEAVSLVQSNCPECGEPGLVLTLHE